MNTILDSDEKKATRPRQMTAVNPAQNPKVEHRIRDFLKALNSGGGKPMETMTPAEARKVLVDAQASVRLELPPCDIEAKTITPEAAVYDRQGRRIYLGRVDDRYVALGLERPAPTRHDLEEALDATLAGKPVRQPTAPAVGCFIADFAQ